MLEKIYQEGKVKGLITETFPEWRQQVVNRVNFLFSTGYQEMTDEQILEYFNDEPYEKLIRNE